MGIEQVKDRVRKLLALATGSSEHEAAAAAAKAQELCDRYNLQAAQIGQGRQRGPVVEKLEISPKKRHREGWESSLLTGLSQACDCSPWANNFCRKDGRTLGQAFMAVGFPADVALLAYLYPYLEATILRRYKVALAEEKANSRRWTLGMTYHYKRGFTVGATGRVLQRFQGQRDARRAQDPGTQALVVVKEHEIQNWIDTNLELKPIKGRHSKVCSREGYAAGRAAANTINLNRPLGWEPGAAGQRKTQGMERVEAQQLKLEL